MELQLRRLASRVVLADSFTEPPRRVAGVDLAFVGEEGLAAAVVLDRSTRQVVDWATFKGKPRIPYIPGLLSFREGPLMVEAVKRLRTGFEALLCNAHGLAHPLLCGCACYVGLKLKKPTVGVATKRLCGEYSGTPAKVGDWAPLTYRGRTVAAVTLTREGCRPIFISPGNLITLESSIRLVLDLLGPGKLPEPLSLAHRMASQLKAEALRQAEGLPRGGRRMPQAGP